MNYSRSLSVALFVFMAIIWLNIPSSAYTFEISDDYRSLTLSNDYLEVYLGVQGTCTYTDDDGNVYTWPVPGRYSIRTVAGDPDNTGDDSKSLTPWAPYPCGHWGYLKIKVGDEVVVVGDSGDWSVKNPPTAYTTPVQGGSLGPGGPYLEGVWETSGTAPVGIKTNISLVRDQIRFEITLTNKSTTTQSIGLGLFGFPLVASDGSGFPFIPGIGLVRNTSGTAGSFPGTLFSGTKVPSSFEIYDSIDNPNRVVRYTLKEQDCTSPDYVAIGEYESGGIFEYDTWLPDDYSPDPQRALDELTCLLEWKQSALAAGASRKYVTYFGVGAASEKWTYKSGSTVVRDSVTAAVQAPRSLKFDSTADAITAPLEITPDPFTISAYVYNTTVDSGTLEGVSAYLYLPEGLELSSTSSARQEIGDVLIGTESDPITWQVTPTGTACGELEYYVAFSDENGWQQTVTRTIYVPAAKKSVLRHGYQMVSVPFTFNDPSLEHAFTGLESGTYRALEYDVSSNSYLPITQVESGTAFWMYVYDISSGSSKSYNLADDAAIIGEYYGNQSMEQYIELSPGWNMFGDPFVYSIYVGQIKFCDSTIGTSYTFDEAVKKGWISRTIYGWNHDRYAYESITSNSSLLVPWKGYWIRAKAKVKMLLRPAAWPDSCVTSLLGGY